MRSRVRHINHALALTVVAVALAGSAYAQVAGEPLEPRVGKLESEMRAVQRKVFPGGNPKYFQPEVQTPATSDTAPATPAQSGAGVAELQVRIQDVEKQLGEITGRIEQTENRTKQLEDQFAKFKADAETRLLKLEPQGSNGSPPVDLGPVSTQPTPAPQSLNTAPVIKKGNKPIAMSTGLKPATAVTGLGAAETAYRAGYATYVARDYDQSEAAFKDFMGRYPQHPLASNVEYWLGRTYLNKKQFGQAARSFLQGYQKYPKGEKAPDSLLGLGEALIALDKPQEACSALSELSAIYPDASASIKGRESALRGKAKCK